MAVDVALAMGVPVRVALFAGFAMLPRFVSAPSGWHGHQESVLSKARLKLWIMHGKHDTEISWALARRSYETLREYNPAGILLERVELTDDDHWSVWDNHEAAARVLRTFVGGSEEEGGDEADEGPPCSWHWDDLEEEQQAHANVLGYDEDSWWNNDERAVDWKTLMGRPCEREAALALGFTEESWVAPSSACDREGEALGLERLLIDDQENHRLN